MADANIGSSINGVSVSYATGADEQVKGALITLIKAVVKPAVASGKTLSSIYISATTNGTHASESRHYTGQAVDISRINGKYLVSSYPSDPEVKAIVDALQEEADKQSGIRENFGPHFLHKHGQSWTVSAHDDHIHFSVDD